MSAMNAPPKTFMKRIRGGIRSLVQLTGYDVVRIPPDDPRTGRASYDDTRALPPEVAVELRPDHPRLLALRERYSKCELPMASRTMWAADYLKDELSLHHFRGDNAYVWQFRNVGTSARLKYYLFLRDVAARDRLGLLNRLSEDGMFGCWTFDYAGWPIVSRDLLDSINELYFLDEHVGLLSKPGFTVLDVGAGYGRLAHRALAAAPQLGAYLCTDAVPESTFLCEFYLRFRNCGARAEVLPLDELDARLDGRKVDLAVNIHSFSEMSVRTIEGWVSRLSRHEVPWLFIVPNDADRLLASEEDLTRREFDSVLAGQGYELVVKQPIFADQTLREFMRVTDHFFLFRHRSATK
jgi:hypothetical protein